MRAKQRTQFCAKSAKNDLKPTDFLKHNFYFEMEGVAFMLDGCGVRSYAILPSHLYPMCSFDLA